MRCLRRFWKTSQRTSLQDFSTSKGKEVESISSQPVSKDKIWRKEGISPGWRIVDINGIDTTEMTAVPELRTKKKSLQIAYFERTQCPNLRLWSLGHLKLVPFCHAMQSEVQPRFKQLMQLRPAIFTCRPHGLASRGDSDRQGGWNDQASGQKGKTTKIFMTFMKQKYLKRLLIFFQGSWSSNLL